MPEIDVEYLVKNNNILPLKFEEATPRKSYSKCYRFYKPILQDFIKDIPMIAPFWPTTVDTFAKL